MDKEKAEKLILEKLNEYRLMDYSRLKDLINREPITGELINDGVKFQYEIEVFWDYKKGGNIRVMGNIDDGGLRAFKPLTYDFIKSPDNKFVGE